jgi:hypothetical protein
MSDLVLGPTPLFDLRDRVCEPLIRPCGSANYAERGCELREPINERSVDMAPLMLSITHQVRNPRQIDVAKQIQIGESFLCGTFDPFWNGTVIVLSIDGRAHNIGVKNYQTVDVVKRLVFARNLAGCDRLYIVSGERLALFLRVVARELGDPRNAKMLGERLSECSLARRLGARHNDPR